MTYQIGFKKALKKALKKEQLKTLRKPKRPHEKSVKQGPGKAGREAG
jgi:hypothetical protein